MVFDATRKDGRTKHAGALAQAELQGLLAGLRLLPDVVERKPGIFYRKSRAFVLFLEDPTGLYADLRLSAGVFERLPVNTLEERVFVLGQASLAP